jgi:hypothetical protein
VIQPERSTSPTAAMVASSIVGLEKGRKGRSELMVVLVRVVLKRIAAF